MHWWEDQDPSEATLNAIRTGTNLLQRDPEDIGCLGFPEHHYSFLSELPGLYQRELDLRIAKYILGQGQKLMNAAKNPSSSSSWELIS